MGERSHEGEGLGKGLGDQSEIWARNVEGCVLKW
jgi:hypothetical protein